MIFMLYGQLIGAIKVDDHKIGVRTSANSEAHKLQLD
jgi:hypothetical protein